MCCPAATAAMTSSNPAPPPSADGRRPMRYRLLGIDLDGTLFDSTGRLPRANIEAIRRAEAAGMVVALCTGRGWKESRSAVEALEHRGPLVLANGALISEPDTGRTLHRAVIEPHLSRPVVDHLAAMDEAVLILLDPAESERDYLVVQPQNLTDNTRWWFEYVGATWREVERATEEDLHHAVRVGIVGPASRMPGVQSSLERRFGEQVFVQHFMAVASSAADGEAIHVLEVFAPGVNKWAALRMVAEDHGIAASAVAAVGDHINDVEMIRGAGCGIAMANAVDAVHAVADRRTASNDEAGVAAAIDRLLGGTW